jgi:predicted phosphoribosyltransferase
MPGLRRFRNRRQAGTVLAASLRAYIGQQTLTLALPRGGVPVAYEVARAIASPLDIFAVRKLGVPGREELALGAIGSGGLTILDTDLIDALGIPPAEITRIVERGRQELEERELLHRHRRPRPPVSGKTILLVDDGVATGASMVVALRTLRLERPAKLVVAVPVGPVDTCEALRRYADDVVCCVTPRPFGGVGAWYADFGQVTDAQVRGFLSRKGCGRAR